MTLPNRLKSARMSNDTAGDAIDNLWGECEQAIADILGVTIDANITAAILGSVDASGRPSSIRLAGTPTTNALRMRDTTNGSEFKLACNNGYLEVYQNTGTEAAPVWTLRNRMNLTSGVWQTGAVITGASWIGCSLSQYGVNVASGATHFFTYSPGAELVDTHGFHSTVTNPERITIPQGYGGIYLITAHGHIVADANGTRRTLQVYKFTPGSSSIAKDVQSSDAFDGTVAVELNVACQVLLNEGNWLQVGVYQDSGGVLSGQGWVTVSLMGA